MPKRPCAPHDPDSARAEEVARILSTEDVFTERYTATVAAMFGDESPDSDFEAMLFRLFAPRAVIDSNPDDPARLERIKDEWRAVIRLMEQGYLREPPAKP